MEVLQFLVGHMKNFTYLVFDKDTAEAAAIDPSYGSSELSKAIEERHLALKYILLTHHHFDHVMEAPLLKQRKGGKIVVHQSSPFEHDTAVGEGDKLKLGKETLSVMHTPGHTADSVCYYTGKEVFTGDTLFVGECGRVDLEDSSPEDMYSSLLLKLSSLRDDVIVYPGHDYGTTPWSTIGREKRDNYTMRKRSLSEFLEFITSP
ncbi:MAG: MBL fold metallo-hydrolase [Methanomassiliicoccales archaeon]